MVGNPVELDTLLDLCRAFHRRILLGVLIEEKRPLTLQDMTKTIAKYNHHATLREIPEPELTRIQTQLHHIHLPKLAAKGLIEYHPESQRVEPTAELDNARASLLAILEADPELDLPIEF